MAKQLEKSLLSQQQIKFLRHLFFYDQKFSMQYFLVNNYQYFFKKALQFEQKIWNQCQYGDLEAEGYRDLIDQTKFIGGFDEHGDCHAVTCSFIKGKSLPPFLARFEFFSQELKNKIIQQFNSGFIDEVGTAAVDYRGIKSGSALRMWALTFLDGCLRGVQAWGIVMEPERVEKMINKYNLPFKQIGPTIDYQGGHCAPHLITLKGVKQSNIARFVQNI
ncbi:Uncharacterised protein [Legionella busanensis]|uniref:Uncharacterized protein n=1 Tax=Legionella busanensis TaxID=190655 RepID=A0A378JQ84_9GAMM|nr:hypothetical protein [Legionella busanensis]STX52090.1 Uncharacterised protein [Legionella busanensis]